MLQMHVKLVMNIKDLLELPIKVVQVPIGFSNDQEAQGIKYGLRTFLMILTINFTDFSLFVTVLNKLDISRETTEVFGDTLETTDMSEIDGDTTDGFGDEFILRENYHFF